MWNAKHLMDMGDRYFLLLFVGFVLVVAGTVVSVGAFEYEVKRIGTADIAPKNVEGFVNYEDLEGREKRVVDRAIAGERVVVRSEGDLPGPKERKGNLGVHKDDTYYILTRHLFFNWRNRFGTASLALWFAGFAAMSEAIRRDRFPHRPVYWIRR